MNARELEQAQSDLGARRRKAVHTAALACVAIVVALPLVWLSPRLAIALAAAAAGEAAVAAAVFHGRRERIARLALDPAAYAIRDVERYGQRCVGERRKLAAWLVEVVAEARMPASFYLRDRVDRSAADLELLARELGASAAKVQPASAVACRRLLTHTVESPLYNPRVPADELRSALLRIRAGIRTRS